MMLKIARREMESEDPGTVILEVSLTLATPIWLDCRSMISAVCWQHVVQVGLQVTSSVLGSCCTMT
eukprot:2097177-Amphidinium_carterae.1